MKKLLLLTSALTLTLFTTACAPPAVKERFFWPPPPEEPKVEHIGVYYNSDDMKTGKFAKLSKSITGGAWDAVTRQPTALVADGHGKVYVSDPVRKTIYLIDFVEEYMSEYIITGIGQPFGIDIDSKGNLFVVDRTDGVVRVFSPKADEIYKFGKEILVDPIRIAVDEERERIYVSDRKTNQVKMFSLDGKFIKSIGHAQGARSQNDGEFNAPNGLAVDATGNLYVCDTLNARIQIFDLNGVFVRKFGSRGDSMTNFESPTEISLDSSGNMWIVDLRKGALLTYSNTSEPTLLFATYGGSFTSGAYNFRGPLDIHIDKNNRIYVPDSLERRISVWQYLDEAYLLKHPLPTNWMQRTDVLDIWNREAGNYVSEKSATK